MYCFYYIKFKTWKKRFFFNPKIFEWTQMQKRCHFLAKLVHNYTFSLCMWLYVYMCMYIYVFMCVCVYIRMYMCVCMNVCRCT